MKIVIVGAGPRGLSVLERIIARGREYQGEKIDIALFDPYGAGGKIWRSNQSLQLVINSVNDQVTLFTDETLSTDGPVVPGPNLYKWSQNQAEVFIQQSEIDNEKKELFQQEIAALDPNGHCSRALYGLYQKWFFHNATVALPPHISVSLKKTAVMAVKQQNDNFILFTEQKELVADKVILALGHHETALADSEKKLADFASQNQLLYSKSQNAADADFSGIKPQEIILLKGLGLSFFDYVTMLTLERGGRYVKKAGKLVYLPSGKEPFIIAGSGRGFPYHPRGINQKSYGQTYAPRFLTDRQLRKWQEKGRTSAKEFYELLKKELEFIYYSLLLKKQQPEIDAERFEQDFITSLGDAKILQDYGIAKKNWWDWDFIEKPDTKKSAEQTYAAFIEDYLHWDFKEAEKGNQRGPVSAAFESLKDMRDQIRFMLDQQLFSNDDLVAWHWQWFVPLNSFLSIGPPAERTAEITALMEAGLLKLLGSKMKVATKAASFAAYSETYPEQIYKARVLMEARLQPTDVAATVNPLLRQLQSDQVAHPYKLPLADGTYFHTGAIAVDNVTNELLDQQEKPIKGLFCYGIPTEGLHWLTAATSRPGTDPWNLREADRIAKLSLTP